ncbi:hypothetical protein, partial [Mesorhizobium sp. M2E.F.Ca.ET.209.01.1.1]|uniref:hypothetical protein n=1 Tax=Mesorhizobium sp. M2E.F.Ca.ET.209.01.1.1 TaxID=2500526 RepID=UPI001AEDB4D3
MAIQEVVPRLQDGAVALLQPVTRDSGGLKSAKASFLHTALCPAGNLPRKGGDRMSRRLSPISNVEGNAPAV